MIRVTLLHHHSSFPIPLRSIKKREKYIEPNETHQISFAASSSEVSGIEHCPMALDRSRLGVFVCKLLLRGLDGDFVYLRANIMAKNCKDIYS